MTLTAEFNNQYEARKDNDYVLSLSFTIRGNTTYHAFDFLTRTLLTRTGSGDGGVAVTPFSQLDREMLDFMRNKLIELKGRPPELSSVAPVEETPAKRLNL